MNKEDLKIALDHAAEARKSEIALVWSRSLYFWGFLAVGLTSYSAALSAKYFALAVLAGFVGFIISICWSLANRSSKFWQEIWEKKADSYAYDLIGEHLFTDCSRAIIDTHGWFAPRRFSVSKLAMAISDLFCFVWIAITIYPICNRFNALSIFLYAIMAISTCGYSIFILKACLTETDQRGP